MSLILLATLSACLQRDGRSPYPPVLTPEESSCYPVTDFYVAPSREVQGTFVEVVTMEVLYYALIPGPGVDQNTAVWWQEGSGNLVFSLTFDDEGKTQYLSAYTDQGGEEALVERLRLPDLAEDPDCWEPSEAGGYTLAWRVDAGGVELGPVQLDIVSEMPSPLEGALVFQRGIGIREARIDGLPGEWVLDELCWPECTETPP